MRWLRLYSRARRVPLALAVAAAVTGLVWGLWLAFADSRASNVRLISLTVLLAVAAFGATLSGADDALDHTASLHWPVRLAGRLIAVAGVITAATLCAAVLAKAGLLAYTMFGCPRRPVAQTSADN